MSNWEKNKNNFKAKTSAFFQEQVSMGKFILQWILLACIVGGIVGSASAGFLYSLEWVTNFRESHLWILVFLPLVGILIGLLYHYFGKAVESGNNLLIEAIHDPGQSVPFRMAPLVYLGTILTHLFGGSAGREGTAIQMAGAISDPLHKVFRLSNEDRRILLISAVAGGFGSVFGTPLAGAIFGLEFFLVGKIRYQAIFPAFLTAIFANWTTHLWQAKHTHYNISSVPESTLQTILWAILAGIFFGLCARLFSRSMHETSQLFQKTIAFPPLRPFVGGILVVLAVWLLGTSKFIGLGVPTIVEAFGQHLPPTDFLLKLIFTVVTLAAGFKGGEVTPLFFIGATLGNALSYFIPLPMGLLAGMGFVAVFAGATNTPIACSIMAIELFGVESGVFVTIACVVAYLVSGHTSIYGKQQIGEPKHPIWSHHRGKKINEL